MMILGRSENIESYIIVTITILYIHSKLLPIKEQEPNTYPHVHPYTLMTL